MSTTPIEDRIAWNIHRQAFDAARARGANFHEATLAGFAATDAQPRKTAGKGTER